MVSKEKIAKRVYNESFRKLCSDKKRIILTLLKLDKAEVKSSNRFVGISKNALTFTKVFVAALYLISLIFKIKYLLIITFFILLFSVILKSKKDPLVILYSITIDKIIKPKIELMDLNALRFANSLGLSFNIIALIFVYWISPIVGWVIVFWMIIIKVASALGFCGGVKLYSCMHNGCCIITKKK